MRGRCDDAARRGGGCMTEPVPACARPVAGRSPGPVLGAMSRPAAGRPGAALRGRRRDHLSVGRAARPWASPFCPDRRPGPARRAPAGRHRRRLRPAGRHDLHRLRLRDPLLPGARGRPCSCTASACCSASSPSASRCGRSSSTPASTSPASRSPRCVLWLAGMRPVADHADRRHLGARRLLVIGLSWVVVLRGQPGAGRHRDRAARRRPAGGTTSSTTSATTPSPPSPCSRCRRSSWSSPARPGS